MRGWGLTSRGRIRLTPAAACVALACGPWPAVAGATSARQVPINVSGSLTYVWHGDSGAGCASEGVCGIRGAVIISQLQGDSQEGHGGVKTAFVDGTGTARVRRDVGSGAPSECLDSMDEFVAMTLSTSGGRLLARVAPPEISGRCAGPLPTELSKLSLPVSRTRDGGYDLRGTVPFTAGPFRGRLISSLVLHRAPRSRGSGSSGFSVSSGGGGRGTSGPPPKSLFEAVQLTYGLSPGTQSLEFDFSGDPGPFCETLDDCGAQGRLIFGLRSQTSVLQLDASRRVRSRQNPRQIIRAFRRDPGAFAETGFAGLPSQASESFSWPGGTTCGDTEVSREQPYGPLQLFVGRLGQGRRSVSSGSLPVVLSLIGAQDALRTHCPGPDYTDVLGEQGVLARGSLAIGRLFQHQQVLDLTRPGPFDSSGYVGSRSGTLELDLSLRRVHAQTRSLR